MAMTTETTTGKVEHINPDEMLKNPAFSQVIAVSGPVKTVYIGGQDAVDRSGAIIGKGDIGKQGEQVVKNLMSALQAAGAGLENLVKCTIYIVQGQPYMPAYEAYRRAWGDRPNPATVTFAYVAGLAHPDFLMEMDAIAVVPIR